MPIYNHFTLQHNPSNPLQIRPHTAGMATNGPTINVEISILDKLAQILSGNNLPIPSPFTGIGLIDTGASKSAVDISVIEHLQILPVGIVPVFTPQGSVHQELFPIKISLLGGPNSIVFNFSSVLGSKLKEQGIIALLGRDILSNCILGYNGIGGHYSLSI